LFFRPILNSFKEFKKKMGKTLLDKVWELHKVRKLPSGKDQIFIARHLIHEVTSPQAFQMLRERKLKVLFPQNTFATVDHIVPTDSSSRPFKDALSEKMLQAIEQNTKEFGIRFFGYSSSEYGVIHVINPEFGLIHPGMTVACGDSHTATHGAFGAIALGIGTSQIRDILATQTLAISKPKIKKIVVHGKMANGVYSKDVILSIIRQLGVNGGIGFAYEYTGEVIEQMSMEERMTLCNMSIEGGARMGYVNPDQITFDYLKNREYVPKGAEFEKAVAHWKSIASDHDAAYDAVAEFDGSKIEPMVTWGINPGQAIGIDEKIPELKTFSEADRESVEDAYRYMNFKPGSPIKGTPINVAFIGSCTNGRISDFREAAKVVRGKKVAKTIRALAVPGSWQVDNEAKKEGLDKIFVEAGFEWRRPGCSMCLAMNPDQLKGNEICASSSNRNFKGRQGSATGRTLLMSPAMVASAAIDGKVSDVRSYLSKK
jgi:3-isopropylmalate/(R)-2-methylmalate dehydratase large subunit